MKFGLMWTQLMDEVRGEGVKFRGIAALWCSIIISRAEHRSTDRATLFNAVQTGCYTLAL
jgi:hypothetical protein